MNYYGYDVDIPSDSALSLSYKQPSRPSGKRYKPGAAADTITPDVAADVALVMSKLDIQRKPRRTPTAMTANQSRWQHQPRRRETDEDSEITPALRPQQPQRQGDKRQYHPALYIGLGMLILLIGWMLLLNAWAFIATNITDRWTYGPNHITVSSGVVGHNKDSQAQPSTFKAFDDHGHIEIIEMPGGDPNKAKIYVSPQLAGLTGWQGDQSNAVIDLEIKDANSDGKPDLIAHVYGPAFSWTFQREAFNWTLINTGDGFKPQQGG